MSTLKYADAAKVQNPIILSIVCFQMNSNQTKPVSQNYSGS